MTERFFYVKTTATRNKFSYFIRRLRTSNTRGYQPTYPTIVFKINTIVLTQDDYRRIKLLWLRLRRTAAVTQHPHYHHHIITTVRHTITKKRIKRDNASCRKMSRALPPPQKGQQAQRRANSLRPTRHKRWEVVTRTAIPEDPDVGTLADFLVFFVEQQCLRTSTSVSTSESSGIATRVTLETKIGTTFLCFFKGG